MPQTTPCILWPIRFAATSYVVRVTVGATTENLTFPASGSLTVGRNYWVSGDAQADSDGGVGGVGDLCAMMLTTLNSHSGVSFSEFSIYTGTNTIKITVSSGTFQILWAHGSTTLSPLIFGFTAASSPDPAAASVVSSNVSQGIWYPGRLPTVDSRDRQPVVGGVAVALSGAQRASRLATPYKTRELSWSVLTQNKSLREYEDATDPYGSAEEMYLSALSLGYPVRYYEDATSRTSTSYTLYVARDMDEIIERDEQYKVRWKADLRLRRVAA